MISSPFRPPEPILDRPYGLFEAEVTQVTLRFQMSTLPSAYYPAPLPDCWLRIFETNGARNRWHPPPSGRGLRPPSHPGYLEYPNPTVGRTHGTGPGLWLERVWYEEPELSLPAITTPTNAAYRNTAYIPMQYTVKVEEPSLSSRRLTIKVSAEPLPNASNLTG